MMTTLDPRTPVLVGGGQISRRSQPLEPVDLIALAAERAADEAGAPDLLRSVDSVYVVGLLSWRYRDPGALVGERIAASLRRSGYTGDGGTNPQALVHRAASDIAAGRSEVVLIGGGESWRTRMKLRSAGERPHWTRQGDDVPPAEMVIPDVPMRFEGQTRVGLDRPSYVYPLVEQALRIAAGRSPAEHQERLGALWSRFSEVAAGNPHAWLQQSMTGEEIALASPTNRMISSPYPKLLNSNNMVDQGAALLLCSVAAAERLGVARDQWVFPVAGAEGNDCYDLGERDRLDVSPAIRAAGRRVMELAEVGIDDIDLIDVYSCFPSAVQVAAAELGLPIDDAARPLTVTGGLTFAGGPWNNYVTHAIATIATRLRQSGQGRALVTANGGYLTKHALGVYATQPPAAGFRWESVQDEVSRAPRRESLTQYAGPGAVEAWTVVHDREGAPERGILSVLTPSGARTFAAATEPDVLARLLADDPAGARATVAADGSLAFSG